MKLRFSPIPTAHARALQSGAPDAYGNPAERAVSDGGGNPCRHCLNDIPAGAGMLIAAYQPFSGGRQPYAETGPIFLCAEPCERHAETDELPELFHGRAGLLIRGYGPDERIVYGTGKVVPTGECDREIAAILNDPKVAFVHLRSATNNCYQARVGRA
jgi:hypothetical protein